VPDIACFANSKGLIRQKAIAYAGYLPWRVALATQQALSLGLAYPSGMPRLIYVPFDHLHRNFGALKGADPDMRELRSRYIARSLV
jgi:hypothetical protein